MVSSLVLQEHHLCFDTVLGKQRGRLGLAESHCL